MTSLLTSGAKLFLVIKKLFRRQSPGSINQDKKVERKGKQKTKKTKEIS